MANIFFPRGEILPPEQILDPLDATSLGLRILSLADLYRIRDRFIGPNLSLNINPEPANETILEEDTNKIILEHEDLALVRFCENAFRSRLPKQKCVDIDIDFFVGTVAGGGWHIDSSNDVRAIVNLSAVPIGLGVAVEWDRKDYGKAKSKYDYFAFGDIAKPPEPISSKTLLYGPGEAVGIINLARSDRQVPHKALPAPGRVVMRLFATLE